MALFEFLRRLFGARLRADAGLEPRIQQLLTVLHRAGLEPTAVELADLLWLAAQLSPTPSPAPASAPALDQTQAGQDVTSKAAPATQPSAAPRTGASRHRPESPQAALYPHAGSLGGGLTARPFRAPAVPLLPNALNLGRALRPLHRKQPSRTRRVLDEEATVQRIAEQRLWQPVLTGVPERWFELALVLDQGASMRVWQPLLVELRRLLTYNGAFRGVRVWHLDTDADNARLWVGENPGNRRACQPEELLVPGGRRLILVVSDCISRAWHTSGGVNRWLRQWSVQAPLAVLQMLPPRLWPRTALGRGLETRWYATAPGLPNTRLSMEDVDIVAPDEAGGEETALLDSALKLPVLALEPEAVLGWTGLLNGKGSAWVAGALFTAATRYAGPAPPASPDAAALEKRLRLFFEQASPLAQMLAGYLAAAPLTLEVMRLVQQVMLPHSGQTHLAEVFVSGLLKKISPDEAQPLYYDFHAGVREELLDLIPNLDKRHVLLAVSDFVAQHTGHCLDFRALLADPTAPGDFALDEEARYFATIGAAVLRRLGGEYLRLARRLEGKKEESEDEVTPATGGGEEQPEPRQPTPFRDLFLDGHTKGPDMIWLPGGMFTMGDDKSDQSDEKPAHTVTLSHFAVGKYPVTFEEYDAFCKATGGEKPEDGGWGRGRRPVIYVSWDEAQAYCQWLRQQTGQDYRLLTEAQWEYACRAGNDAAYCFGDDEEQLGEYAWYWKNSESRTHPIGQKRANPWGLHDTHGNVWEWVYDWDGHYWREPRPDPSGPETGSRRIIRGGGWNYGPAHCRSAYRDDAHPDLRVISLGFRLARTGSLSSYPFTLVQQQAEKTPVQATSEPEQRYEPYQGFRDRLPDGTAAPEMVYLPAGTFKMGDSQGIGWEEERPVRNVILDAFAIGRYPVTAGEFRRFVEATRYQTEAERQDGANVYDGKKWGKKADTSWRNPYMPQDDNHPVVCISWKDAVAYCEWLSKQTRERYSLLTEAEWEYACRASSDTAYCFGDDTRLLDEYAWYSENATSSTHPVGEKKANHWNLHDI